MFLLNSHRELPKFSTQIIIYSTCYNKQYEKCLTKKKKSLIGRCHLEKLITKPLTLNIMASYIMIQCVIVLLPDSSQREKVILFVFVRFIGRQYCMISFLVTTEKCVFLLFLMINFCCCYQNIQYNKEEERNNTFHSSLLFLFLC